MRFHETNSKQDNASRNFYLQNNSTFLFWGQLVSTTGGGLTNSGSNSPFLNTLCGGINLIPLHQRSFFIAFFHFVIIWFGLV